MRANCRLRGCNQHMFMDIILCSLAFAAPFEHQEFSWSSLTYRHTDIQTDRQKCATLLISAHVWINEVEL